MNPLDQLADITTPSAVSIWPLAWGYWLAMGIVLSIIALGIFAIVKFRNRRKAKREALLALNNLDTADKYYAHRVHVLMKSLCSYYLPTASCSQMHGKHWHSLVLSVYQGTNTSRLSDVLDSIYQALYSPSSCSELINIEHNAHIQITIKEWIKTSFPNRNASNSQAGNRRVVIAPLDEVKNA